MGAALEYVEAFTKLIVRNKPAAVIAAKQAAAQEHSEDAGSTDAVPAPSESFRDDALSPSIPGWGAFAGLLLMALGQQARSNAQEQIHGETSSNYLCTNDGQETKQQTGVAFVVSSRFS
jgi:hypothetical protein